MWQQGCECKNKQSVISAEASNTYNCFTGDTQFDPCVWMHNTVSLVQPANAELAGRATSNDTDQLAA